MEWDAAHQPRLDAALRLLSATCKPGTSVADLGCLHGGYTREFALAGYDAYGIEAREDNFAYCQRMAEDVGLPNLEFFHDDVRNLADYGPFGAVFCCGLLYHMDKPAELLHLIAERTTRLLILNTHFSAGGGAVNEGLPGHWYLEGGADDPESGWGNGQSFWLTRAALLGAVQDAGFPLVAEIHDQHADLNGAPDRITLAAVKSPQERGCP